MKAQKKRMQIIVVAIVVSFVLYFAGALSGLYANRLIKEETTQNIQTLKQETKEDLQSLQGYISFLDANLKNMQLEENFMETLSPRARCNFSTISFNNMIGQLSYYWDKLPYRIEEYERSGYVSEDYILLKQQYAHVSIRTWLLAKGQYEKCNMNIVHGLYFYSSNCSVCVKQGEQIDELHRRITSKGSELIMFPIDFNSNESIIKNLKEFYGIKSTPAIIKNDKVFQGRFFTSDELLNHPSRKN